MNTSKVLSRSLLLIPALLASCANIKPDNEHESSKLDTKPLENCSILRVTKGGETIGSGFIVSESSTSILLTASHVVRNLEARSIQVHTPCSSAPFGVRDILHTPKLDVAVLIINHTTLPSYAWPTTTPKWGDRVTIPNYASFEQATNKLKGLLIPSAGRFIEKRDEAIFVTLDVVQKGSSGAPILNSSNQVVGLLTNRVISDGNYGGISMGIDYKNLREALAIMLRDLR